jgi:polar amino acid transport system ATP-binding protein
MDKVSLYFSDVSFGFHTNNLLFEHLNLSVENTRDQGKIIALMGPSGVGKTTFCELMLGIRKPQCGTIKFAPQNLNVAVIPQKGIIFEELTVNENIACLKHSITLGPTFRGERVRSAADSLGLMQVLQNDTKPNQLSGGEAQRVMLARIQTIDCNLLILDEPCSFLDNKVKDSFLAQVRQTIEKSRILALMVTHVWDEARLIADEVIFFNRVDQKAVTLHSVKTSEAEEHPPTIDALYGIWWPSCLIVKIDDAIKLAGKPANGYPASTCFVGLYLCYTTGQTLCDNWAGILWRQVGKSIESSQRCMLNDNKHNATKHIIATFYDKNEVVVIAEK